MPELRDIERMVDQTLPLLVQRTTSIAGSMQAQVEAWSDCISSPWWSVVRGVPWDSNDLEKFIAWMRQVWSTNAPSPAIQGFWVSVPELDSQLAETYVTGSEIFDPFDEGWAASVQWLSSDDGPADFTLHSLSLVSSALESARPSSITLINGRPSRAMLNEMNAVGYAVAMAYVSLLVVHATRELAAIIAPTKTKYFACGARNGSVFVVSEVSSSDARPFHKPTRSVWKKAGNRFHADPWSGKVETVALYLEQGSDPNITLDGKSPILCCHASHGSAPIVKALLQAGANVEGRDELGRTALHHATQHPETLQVLLAANANVNAVDSEGCTPLHRLVFSHTVPTESARIVLQTGADVHAVNQRGATPLEEMCRISTSDERYGRRFEQILKLLIEHGADINRVGRDGMTPLGMAAVHESFLSGEILVRHGADPNTRLPAPFIQAWANPRLRRFPDGGTPLMATIYKSSSFHEALLAAGADPLPRCDAGLTAIDHARLMRSSKWSDAATVDRIVTLMEAKVADKSA